MSCEPPKKKHRTCPICNENYTYSGYYSHVNRVTPCTPNQNRSDNHQGQSAERTSLSDTDSIPGIPDEDQESQDLFEDISTTSSFFNDDEVDQQDEDVGSDISFDWSDDVFEDEDDGIDLQDLQEPEADDNIADEGDFVHVEGQDRYLILLLCKLIFYWQVLHGVSERVVHSLLCILSGFFIKIAQWYPSLLIISKSFPPSLHRFRKMIGNNRDNFKKFVMCPKCAKLYNYDEISGPNRIVKCKNSWLIRHLPRREIGNCSANLVKEVRMANNKVRVYPLKTYCYNSILDTLQSMIKRPNFLEKCNNWQARVSPPGIMTDVYDGAIWQRFFGKDGQFPGENRFAFLINVDWFQPYKRRSTSIGAIYLTCLNLPREQRYKREYIIVVGIIPSLGDGGEPSSLNSLLKPLVDEFNTLFKGYDFQTDSGNITGYGYLLGCSSDIPANKKLCGFLSHSAHKGCSRCYTEFKSMKIANNRSKLNYSGFDERRWKSLQRTNEDHRDKAKRIGKATDKRHQGKLEIEYGLRYSRLLELPYYDAIRFCFIDPMHNLFLGTPKKMFSLWLDLGILNSNSLQILKQKIQKVKVPGDIGRIPSNIESNHSRFTAEEWKNWTLYYSPIVLLDIIPDKHYKCWQKFVLACTYICSPYLTELNIKLANLLFFEFGKEVAKVYGAQVVTPNMHYHGHLAECVKDVGPVHSFWCFAFERFNGVIADIPTNHHSIEIQYMRSIMNWASAGVHHHDHGIISTDSNAIIDSVVRSLRKHLVFPSAISLIPSWNRSITAETVQNLASIKLPKSVESQMLTEDMALLRQMYCFFYNDDSINYLAQICSQYRSITIGQERFGSLIDKRSSKSSYITAVWCGPSGQILSPDQANAREYRPGKINYFLKHSVNINGQVHDHIIACVRWYYGNDQISESLKPLSLWTSNKYVPPGPANFIPVQRITGKCAMYTEILNNRLYICPLHRKL